MTFWDMVAAVIVGLVVHTVIGELGAWFGRQLARWQIRRRLPGFERRAAMERELARDKLAASLDAAGVPAEERDLALAQADAMMDALMSNAMAEARRAAGVD